MTNTEVATTAGKPPAPMIALRNFLDARMAEIKTALPAHISPERFIRVVITAAQINPEILACERASLWNACMRAANDGLLPDGVEAALVPFKGRASYIPMYQGLLKKFRNSGEFKWVTAGIVYEGDQYEHWIDETGEHFRHVPADATEGRKIRRVYALATTKDGGHFIADLPLADINKRRNMSRASREDAPWKVWPDEMMKKTAIRVLSKYLPKSSDVDALMQRDEEAIYGVESVEERRQTIARPADTAAALDAFGSTSLAAETPSAGSGERLEIEAASGGGQEQPAQTDETPPAARESHSSESTPGAPAAADQSAAEQKAYDRGKADRAKGAQRRAVPGDLRENNRLAQSWGKGWDDAGK